MKKSELKAIIKECIHEMNEDFASKIKKGTKVLISEPNGKKAWYTARGKPDKSGVFYVMDPTDMESQDSEASVKDVTKIK